MSFYYIKLACEIRSYMRLGMLYLNILIGFIWFTIWYLPFTIFFKEHTDFLQNIVMSKVLGMNPIYTLPELIAWNSYIWQMLVAFIWLIIMIFILYLSIKTGKKYLWIKNTSDFLWKNRLKNFNFLNYENFRNDLDKDWTSRLSVYLRFWIFSVREVYLHIKDISYNYISELAWREFW